MKRCRIGLIFLALLHWSCGAVTAISPSRPNPGGSANGFDWSTNGPAVYSNYWRFNTNIPVAIRMLAAKYPERDVLRHQAKAITNTSFNHYIPESLHHHIWTNFMVQTNHCSLQIWSTRSHPVAWPTDGPIVAWNTNGLMWGFRGLTALSPCSELEGSPGQVPITALTRRHGYTLGHGMGPNGFRTRYAGKKAWFLALDNTLVEVTILREVVRTSTGGSDQDYTLLLFNRDLPDAIEPIRVTSLTNILTRYTYCFNAPRPLFLTEQGGRVGTTIPGWDLDTLKGGDSGSPNLLPLPKELVFYGGRTTSGPSSEMQADMDALCRLEGLETAKYQLQWVDLSHYPAY